jgi:hypothetical protein
MSTITKPSRPTRAQQAFVEGAPGGKPARKLKPDGVAAGPVARSPRKQITINVPVDVLRRLDAMAAENGQTRAGLIALALARLLRAGV